MFVDINGFKILIWYDKNISKEENRWDEYKKKYLECFQKEIDYYIIGHFSKFVQKDAYRIYSNTFEGELETVAFQNPDGSIVVVTLNPSWNIVTYNVNWNNMYFNHSLSAQSMATFVWEP